MNYVDVILPLPLDGVFTYAVPAALAPRVAVGVRVLVPFGRSKRCVGLVADVHDRRPEGYEVKPLHDVMDPAPVVLADQLRLWRWMSDYYMAPLGEVYKAAMPSGMKGDEGYRPRTETYIRLTPPYHDEATLHAALDMLARATKQHAALTAYLDMAGCDEGSRMTELRRVTREELMASAHVALPTLNMLVRRGMMETYEVEVGRLNHGGEPHPENMKPLSTAQQEAYNRVLMSFMRRRVTLLHGVTGSGKTEIYIHLIQRELDSHRQVLFLMPEIALTVQMMERLRRVFGHRLGIYHSKYSDAERVEMWQKQLSACPYDVILGARSAVMLPFQRLGLVIVDEEHETSYKQHDPMPRYHARSVAIMTQADHVLLGTATPSVETYHNAVSGKYGLVELTERYKGVELPEVVVVDTADLARRKMMAGPFSPLLLARVREALERGEQALLFQNRRGWAPQVVCRQCGWVPRCEHCDVALTLHRSMNQLTCHYCGFTYAVPTVCPACGSHELQGRGYGTEKIEDQIADLLPMARVGRMDMDTTRTRRSQERIIADFEAGRTNLLVGTQMVTKGLDFDRVAVVGILDADTMLNQPDFRAYEHAYMMMTQVSGRAGRKGRRGLVVLQTKSPGLPVIDHVVRGDYRALYADVMAERQAFGYPPYRRLTYVYLKHRSDAVADTAAHEMATRLRQWFGVRVLGPDRPVVARVKTLSIRQIVLKLENGIDMPRVRQYLRMAHDQLMQDKRYAALQVYFDVDPL